MQKIIIVGAGPSPSGLLLSIQLAKLGLDVTIVDPRIDAYTRVGILDKSRFEDLSDYLGETVAYSEVHHIKDMERSLYDIAKLLNIKFKKASFEGFKDKAVRIKNGTTEEVLPADLVIDASGSRRVVVKEVNKLKLDSFHIQPINNIPLKDHLLAYVKISDDDRAAVVDFKSKGSNTDPSIQVAMLEALRAMGWEGFINPTFYYFLLHKEKACFYVEMPPNLDVTKYEQWLKNVIVLNTGKTDFTFQQMSKSRKYPTKQRFGKFTVDPHGVQEAYYRSKKLPCVIPIGNAKIDPEYRLGMGIKTAKAMIECLLSAIVILDPNTKEFTVDFSKYEKSLVAIITDHELQIISFYNKRRNEILASLKRQKNNYEKLMSTSPVNLADLKSSYLELMLLFHQKTADKINGALNINGTIKLDGYGLIQDESTIVERIELLDRILEMLPISSVEFKKMQMELKTIAFKYKELGTEFYNRKNFGLSFRCYSQALSILQKHLSNSEQEAIIKLQSNLIVVSCKIPNYERALNLVDTTLKMISSISMQDKDKLLTKIIFHKTLAMIHLLEKQINTTERVLTLAECKQNIEMLENDPNVDKPGLKMLINLFEKAESEKPMLAKGFFLN